MQCGRFAADCSRQKTQVLSKVIASDDVTSGLQSDVRPPKDNSDATQQREATSSAPFRPPDSRHGEGTDDDVVTAESACDAVNSQAGSTKHTTVSNWNVPATIKYGDQARKGDVDSDNHCRTDNSRGGDLRLEAVTKNDSDFVRDDDESQSASRQRRDDFTLDGPSSSSSINFNTAAAMANSVRSVAKSDVDVQSAPSSLYAVYAQSPGSRRREQQQRARRTQLDPDADRRSPSPHQFRRTHDADDRLRNDGGAPTPRPVSTHGRRAPGRQVSSSFENLVGGLLAAPQPQPRCHLANATETAADSNAVLPASDDYSSADSLCGRGADFLPVLTAFLATGTSMTTAYCGSSSLPANLTADREPELVLPRHTKHVPPHVRRAKHLFKSCVGRRSTPTHRPKDY